MVAARRDDFTKVRRRFFAATRFAARDVNRAALTMPELTEASALSLMRV
jgi:hypothetical protein